MQASGTEKEGSGRRSEPEPLFSSILGSAPRCPGGFSLQLELCFYFGVRWQRTSTLGSILESFWEPQAQLCSLGVSLSGFLVAKWGCRSIGDFLWISGGGQASRERPGGGYLGALGPLILNPTDCHRRQDTGSKTQDTGYSIQHTHTKAYRSRGIRRCKNTRRHRMQETGSLKPLKAWRPL